MLPPCACSARRMSSRRHHRRRVGGLVAGVRWLFGRERLHLGLGAPRRTHLAPQHQAAGQRQQLRRGAAAGLQLHHGLAQAGLGSVTGCRLQQAARHAVAPGQAPVFAHAHEPRQRRLEQPRVGLQHQHQFLMGLRQQQPVLDGQRKGADQRRRVEPEGSRLDGQVEHAREFATPVVDGCGRARHAADDVVEVFPAVDRHRAPGGHHQRRRIGARSPLGQVHAHTRRRTQHRHVGLGRRCVPGVDDDTVAAGQQQPATGAAECGFQPFERGRSSLQQPAVAAQRAVHAAACDRFEGDRVALAAPLLQAAHPRLDHRLGHQPRRPQTLREELLARAFDAAGVAGGEQGLA
jgi:hypothetical protein